MTNHIFEGFADELINKLAGDGWLKNMKTKADNFVNVKEAPQAKAPAAGPAQSKPPAPPPAPAPAQPKPQREFMQKGISAGGKTRHSAGLRGALRM